MLPLSSVLAILDWHSLSLASVGPPGCQKLHIIGKNHYLLILTTPVVPARSSGKFWTFYSVSCEIRV